MDMLLQRMDEFPPPPAVAVQNGSVPVTPGPPPIPSSLPVVNGAAKEEQSPMTQAMHEFLSLEATIGPTDYMKKFYQIRLAQEALRGEPEFSCDAACNSIHFSRNRYRDILPYDHNRVVLKNVDPGENPDGYVNASTVHVPGGHTSFIAAQAPLPTTIDEFWQMVDEQGCHLIVMLCRLVEMSKVKCERYWPEEVGETEIYGSYEVTLESEESFPGDDEYVLRTLKLSPESGDARTVRQLHYREWPDHGCPSGEQQLLNMVDRMAVMQADEPDKPVLVHCSAGVGRTGTIIAVNHIRELLETQTLTPLDLFELVMCLRKQRTSMVQTHDQYQFVHRCIAHYFRRRLGLPCPQPEKKERECAVDVPPEMAASQKPLIDLSSDDDCDDDGEPIPDYPLEPSAPRGPEEISS